MNGFLIWYLHGWRPLFTEQIGRELKVVMRSLEGEHWGRVAVFL